MSSVNFLEKLLDGAAVEWKTLDDVCHVASGSTPSKAKKEYWDKGDIPWLKSESCNNQSVYTAENFITELGLKNSSAKILDKDTTLIALVGATIFKTAYLEFEAATNQNIASIKSKDGKPLNDKFVFYYLTNLYGELKAKMRNYGMLNLSTLRQFKIPIPCPNNPKKSLAIQAEIVRILDTFTQLTSELTTELTSELAARKKQYHYYREQLLSFKEGEVQWKTLGDVALEFGRGKSKHRPRNDPRLYGGNIPFIQTGDIRSASHIITEHTQTYSNFGLEQSKLWPKGTLCITIAANIAETTILGFDSCFPDSVIGFVANPEKTNSSYVEYLLSSFKTKLQSQSTGSAQDNINMGTFENMRFPFPPLTEQERIVAILDKFDALTNSISEGLPREIALRQKQYQYYRDLLLSFPQA